MEVSTFEIVYKPQSPMGPADTVLQGYFLEISNLENVELLFRLDFVTSSVTNPDRSLQNNAAVVVDVPNDDNTAFSLIGDLESKSFRLAPWVRIPACGTALVAVLPSDAFVFPNEPANFEVRGFVTLRLPAVFKVGGGRPFPRLQAQLKRPARVLLTPQNRALYIGADGENNAQTQASVPLATGKALNEIEPEKGSVIPADGTFDMGELLQREASRPAMDFSLEALALQVAAAAGSEMDLKSFNAALKDAGVGMSMEKRKVAGKGKAA